MNILESNRRVFKSVQRFVDKTIGVPSQVEIDTKLKELDPEKIRHYGKLTDNEDDLSKLFFIKKEKTRVIFEKFKTRR